MRCLLITLSLFLFIACNSDSEAEMKMTEDKKQMTEYHSKRINMVKRQIEGRGIEDSLVLDAMRSVPRHLFVPEQFRDRAYEDNPLPIGENQTISQPYIVALMTDSLALKGGERILEVGTGSGYQAAVLAEIVDSVYTIEIVRPLGERARDILDSLHYDNVKVMIGDGYRGYEEAAPFDGIIVTAAPEKIPQPLIDQLRVGGRMVIPVGGMQQYLKVLVKTDDGLEEKTTIPVRFVPMTGEAQEK